MKLDDALERAKREFGHDLERTSRLLEDFLEGRDPGEWRKEQSLEKSGAREVCDFIDWSDKNLIATPLSEVLREPTAVPVLVEAPTGSGKTHAAIQSVSKLKKAPSIIATNTLRAQDDLLAGLEGKLAPDRIMDLRSSVKTGPISEVDAVVTNHANMCSRGDWGAEQGRLFAKLDSARAQGMREPEILVDEADAWLSSLARSHDLGFRWKVVTDKRTGLSATHQIRSCPRDCANCNYGEGVSAFTSPEHDSFRLAALANPPANAAKIDTDWLLELAPHRGQQTHGWEIRRIDRDRAVEATHAFPDFRHNTLGEKIPSPKGILAAVAASPGATLRRAYPRDAASGLELSPEQVVKMARGKVVYPKKACNVWSLVGWDMRPLELLFKHSPGARFLSGSWSETSVQLLSRCERIAIPTPQPQKMAEIMLLAVSSMDYTADNLAKIGKSAPALLFRSTRERALAMTQATIKSGAGAIYSDGAMHTTGDTTDIPKVTVSYPRSSLGRGLNLGSRKTVIVEADVHGSYGYMPLSGPEKPAEAIEAARRALISQAVGRSLRRDERGCEDDMRRAVILVSGKEKNGQLEDDGLWLEYRLGQIADKVFRVELRKYPGRAETALRQFHDGVPVTVRDGKGLKYVSDEQREKIAEKKKKLREEKRKKKREELFGKIENEHFEGTPWRTVYRRFSLSRYFSKDELVTIREAYCEGKPEENDGI